MFNPEPLDMLNDAYLGLFVVALGGMIWAVYLIVKDPRGVRPPLDAPVTTETPAEVADSVSVG